MKFTIAFCERSYCEFARHPLADMTVRDNLLRKAGLLSRGGHGTSAPVATGTDIVRMTIGLVCSRQAKDVVEGYRKVSRFKLVRAREEIEAEGTARKVDPPFPIGATLEDALHACFREKVFSCPGLPDLSLQVDHSLIKPRAYLAIGPRIEETSPDQPVVTLVMTFEGPPEAAVVDYIADEVEYSTRLRWTRGLSGLYQLLEGLIPQIYEPDPSVAAVGSDRLKLEAQVTKDLMDRYGAPTPKHRTTD
jgi:hypothetical protein